MTIYTDFVAALKKDGADIRDSMTADQADLIHMCLGLTGEVGELVDAIKKYIVYGKGKDMENIIEEMGDIEFFLEGFRTNPEIGISRNKIINKNIEKLKKRYPEGGYSNKQAIMRADKNVG